MKKQTYSDIQEDILHKYSLITNEKNKEEQFMKYLDSTREQLVIIAAKYNDGNDKQGTGRNCCRS